MAVKGPGQLTQMERFVLKRMGKGWVERHTVVGRVRDAWRAPALVLEDLVAKGRVEKSRRPASHASYLVNSYRRVKS